MIGCLVLGGMLKSLLLDQENALQSMDAEMLREVYPELLKRLDDSNDQIRAAVCKVFETFFQLMSSIPKWSDSVYQYIIKTLFIHLDDPNPEMQAAMNDVLNRAVHVSPMVFYKEAQSAGQKSTHPRACEELARLAQTLASNDEPM